MDVDTALRARFEMLQQQKELLKKAKSRAGQKPTKAMRRSRAQLEQEYLTSVYSCRALQTLKRLILTGLYVRRLSMPT